MVYALQIVHLKAIIDTLLHLIGELPRKRRQLDLQHLCGFWPM